MASLTRASLRASRATSTERKTLFTGLFWADLAERVITSAAGGALTVVSLDGFNLITASSWEAIAVGAGVAGLISLLKGIAAAGSGSASLVPSV